MRGVRWAVVDSSVAVKWFSPFEPRYREALAVLVEHEERRLCLAAPTLLRVEVMNALCRRSDVGPADLLEAANVVEGFSLEWFDLTPGIASDAAVLAAETGLSVYDALFVALARELDAELITDDRQIIASKACRIRPLT